MPRFQVLTGRQRMLLFGGVGALILALLAGLLTWVNSSSESATPTAKRNLEPFEEAVDDLARTPGLRYRDTAIAGITERDITVTASGSQFGTTGSGNKEHDHDVLRIGGKTFTRWQVDPAPDQDVEPGTRTPGEWSVGYEDGSKLLSKVLDQRPSPSTLAAQLSKALEELGDVPQADDSEQRPLTVNGTPALGIDTSTGRLLVTEQKPHRVLRLEPYDLSELAERFQNGEAPTEIPQVTTGPLAEGDSEGMDLIPIVGDAVVTMFDTLLKQAKQLNRASDSGINFTLDGSGDMNCGPAGCSVNQKFTGEVTSGAQTRITDGRVTAIVSATFTIGGQPAGRCTSTPSTFPVTGNSVSGTLTCSNPGAGPVYASVAARYKAQAEAQSRAGGGRTVRYSIPLRANTLIDARALAAVEVKQLVERVQRERDTANCAKPRSFPSGTQVLLADGSHRAIEDIRVGDRVTATDPERRITTARPVTSVITTEDDKDFTRLTVTTDRGPATITATDNHPFWLANDKRWTDAKDVRVGDELRSSTGPSLPVTAVLDEQGRQRTHDLTVNGVHTYYVLAGGAPLLVHNQDCPIGFTEDTVSDAFTGMNKGGGHAMRHLIKDGLIPNKGSVASQAAYFQKKFSPVLTSPDKTFDWKIGGTQAKGFAAKADGRVVVLFVAKEGPYQGKVLSAMVPGAQNMTKWGLW
ncbi:Hint domain-containing protein [Streptomyces sp. NPDC002889]|uniref:Hint domain-containing protein n=1 Tax=Streptomyces sp. NPDC002889 TaxID=3364669 RepID=UPI00369D9923